VNEIKNPLVWIDCEMTGLDTVRDALIEVAVVITDGELNVVDPGMDVVIRPDAASLEGMNDFVRNMHTRSGLIDELDAGLSMQEASERVLAYIKRFVPRQGQALLAGNSVGNDKNFLERDMAPVIEHLHYRIVDVSSLKELARRWYPTALAAAPEKTGNHRALGDILDSIAELRYYREAVMVPSPGPDAAAAAAIATKVTAAAAAD